MNNVDFCFAHENRSETGGQELMGGVTRAFPLTCLADEYYKTLEAVAAFLKPPRLRSLDIAMF
jgi:hypothetical protein